mmetsp:Transcript_413/g.917  ORF Transcript_413/g.917 Transcript_413/m.917 type:complete len:818 (+) Transcript_413:79-2532(+)
MSKLSSLSKGIPSGVILFTHDACILHAIDDHPEQPRRVPAIVDALVSAFPPGGALRLEKETVPLVTDEQLLRFHTSGHVKRVTGACEKAEAKARALAKKLGPVASGQDLDACLDACTVSLDGDTAVMRATNEAARRAAGACVAAVDAVLGGQARSAFVAVRPPGHHAEPDQAMGFCLYGNAGVAAMQARAVWGLEKVAVVDWDVHHGNGTQAFFEKDPKLFFASSHQMPCYPGTGHPRETGVASNVVNCALSPGSGSVAFRDAWRNTILPKLRAFQPELIIVSAGFDAHGEDPLAEVQLEDGDFGWVQGEIVKVAEECCGGRVVSCLEGGYNLGAIARSAVHAVTPQVTAAQQAAEKAAQQAAEEEAAQEEAAAPIGLSTGVEAGPGEKAAKEADISDALAGMSLAPAAGGLVRAVREGFARCQREGLLRTPGDTMAKRVLPGPLGLTVAFDALHFANKRGGGHLVEAVPVDQAFDAAKFHFAKADPRERVASAQTTRAFLDRARRLAPNGAPPGPGDGDAASHGAASGPAARHPVLANVSPLMPGHSVIPLWCEELRAQRLDSAAMAATVEVALGLELQGGGVQGDEPRLGFNSLGAFASVNHLHVHLMFGAFPVEPFTRPGAPGASLVSPAASAASPRAVEVTRFDGWPVPGFAFRSAPRAAEQAGGGGEGAAAAEAAASVAGAAGWLVDRLFEEGTPFNVLVVPPNSGEALTREAARGLQSQGEGATDLAVLVFPRQPQELFGLEAAGFNAAVCEVGGLLVAHTPEAFGKQDERGQDERGLTEAKAEALLREGVAVAPSEMDRIARLLRAVLLP